MKRASTYVLLRGFVLLAFLVLVGRLWYMQIVEVQAYRNTATSFRVIRTVSAPRGIIYDSRGKPLVRNLPVLGVTVTPAQWGGENPTAESKLLSRLLHRHPPARRIRWLIRHGVAKLSGITTSPIIIRSGLSYRAFVRVKANANRLPGVDAGTVLNRRVYLDSYPYPLAHILGYSGPINSGQCRLLNCYPYGYGTRQRYTQWDYVGQTGLESTYERQLHGTNGVEAAQVDSRGNQVTGWRTVNRTIAGQGLRLTINAKFEGQVAQDVEQAMQKEGWHYGAAVAMNPWNGHILAMVSLPSFNGNLFTAIPRNRRVLHALDANPLHPQYDYATDGEYPPGSIYKVVTATAGLASGVINPGTIVDDTGKLQRVPNGPIFNGWYAPGLGPVNVVRAIAESSDIFFYQVAGGGPDIAGNGVGVRRLSRWARRYGLGQHTGIELPDQTGLVPTAKELMQVEHRPWSYGDSYHMGIGQGADTVTPLQMARVVSVIANGGSLVRPTLIEGLTGPDGKHFLPGKDYGAVPDVVRRNFVPHWITHLIGYGMRLGVVMHGVYPQWGTSYGQVDARTQAAGKTGTAQTFLPGTCGTPKGCVASTDAWWMGFAPYNHPRIAVAVVFPYADSEGAYAAAPVASKIILDFEHKKAPGWLSKVSTTLVSFN